MTHRSGFTLVELIVVMVVMAILGTALTRVLISDSRFVDRVDAMMAARHAARSAMTLMTVELQMVGSGGLIAPTSASQITVRRTYAAGVSCGVASGYTVASLMPVDSLTYAASTPTGVWWDSSGTGISRTVNSVTFGGSTTPCAAHDVLVVPGGWLVTIDNSGPAIPQRTGFNIFEQIAYSFEPSTSTPGRMGLFRTDGLGVKEELMAPFDSTARFTFLVGDNLTPQAAPPADLDDVRGLELHLVGESYRNPQGSDTPAEFDLRTSILFRNRM